MLQYFKFNENAVENKRYQLLTGKKAYLFLSKSALVSIFMMYATFFVAAAIPFLSPNNPAVPRSIGCRPPNIGGRPSRNGRRGTARKLRRREPDV